jgi:hypothetical protein
MHRHVCSLALLAAVAACFLLAATNSDADRLEARDLAYEAMDVYSEDGFHIREELQLGKLGKGESYYFDTQLSANNEYFFYVGGDDTVYALQLRIYDENWELVTANIMHEPQAEVTYLTEWSGIYHVKVTMADCEEHGGYWFLISGFK